ncbi:MAG: hypothetical protein WDN06_01890 [Asticcacaulis sp.]
MDKGQDRGMTRRAGLLGAGLAGAALAPYACNLDTWFKEAPFVERFARAANSRAPARSITSMCSRPSAPLAMPGRWGWNMSRSTRTTPRRSATPVVLSQAAGLV